MEALADGVSMFYGMENRYPDSLAELAAVEPRLCSLSCPSCELSYLYSLSGSGEVYTITCPIPAGPDHGYVKNGHSSWPPDPSEWYDICQSNMSILASCCAMFYGIYNKYPEELSELGSSGIYEYWDDPCPACGEFYTYYTDSGAQDYSIHCPLPWLPGHGYVINGIRYWTLDPDTTGSQDACRSNMLGLRTGCIIFYGMENRWPYELSELGTSGAMENWDDPCPACGELYYYSIADSTAQSFMLHCPLPWLPGHGYVEDGYASWQ